MVRAAGTMVASQPLLHMRSVTDSMMLWVNVDCCEELWLCTGFADSPDGAPAPLSPQVSGWALPGWIETPGAGCSPAFLSVLLHTDIHHVIYCRHRV